MHRELAMKRDHAVVIVGAGPTGMMLAGELRLAGIDVAIVEKRLDAELLEPRARGMFARSLEVLDQRGIAERFVSQGQRHPAVHFHVPLDIRDLPTRHNYVLALMQKHIERILCEWIGELHVPLYRGLEVTGCVQDEDGVDVLISGSSMRAQYLVGCDGGRSTIRKAAGIEFIGWRPTTSWIMADAHLSEEPAWGVRRNEFGTHVIGHSEESGGVAMVLNDRALQTEAKPTLRDLSAALIAVYGTDFGVHRPRWISRFTDSSLQATKYREGRVLLAGDAAHVHPPVGGLGLNTGIQDAVNLGWKLAQVVQRRSPPSLLDSYHAERHPMGARVLKNTMAHIAIRRTDERTQALGEFVAEFLSMNEPRAHMAAEMTGLNIRYDIGGGGERHPLLGRRMPDLDLVTPNGPTRVFALLHAAHPLLINFAEPGSLDIGDWANRVRTVDATCAGAWDLPAIGAVAAPAAVLIRPDGHVAWVGDGSDSGLTEALAKWF